MSKELSAKDTVMGKEKLRKMYIDWEDEVGAYFEEHSFKRDDPNAPPNWDNVIIEAQADISFKAGQDSVFDSMPENLPPLLEAAHKAGREEERKFILQNTDRDERARLEGKREMAEWIKKHRWQGHTATTLGFDAPQGYLITEEELRAQLKEG